MADDIYIRYQCFRDASDMKAAMMKRQPHKIDIGAVFSCPPKDHLTVSAERFHTVQVRPLTSAAAPPSARALPLDPCLCLFCVLFRVLRTHACSPMEPYTDSLSLSDLAHALMCTCVFFFGAWSGSAS